MKGRVAPQVLEALVTKAVIGIEQHAPKFFHAANGHLIAP